MSKVPKPKVEYRIVCARYHESRGADAIHRSHAYGKSTLEKAEKMVLWNNEHEKVFRDNPVPSNQGCLPWTIEARVVTEWEPLAAAEELAVMLERDWYDPPELWEEPA